MRYKRLDRSDLRSSRSRPAPILRVSNFSTFLSTLYMVKTQNWLLGVQGHLDWALSF